MEQNQHWSYTSMSLFFFFSFFNVGVKKKRKMNRRKIMIKNIAIEKVKVNNKKATELKIMR